MTESHDQLIVTRAFAYRADDPQKILIGLRASGQGEDLWNLIGGKPKNESLRDCIVREVLEETGSKFNPIDNSNYVFGGDTPTDWMSVCFEGTIEGELHPTDEISDFRFISREEVVIKNSHSIMQR